jgi:hypothetical protein
MTLDCIATSWLGWNTGMRGTSSYAIWIMSRTIES